MGSLAIETMRQECPGKSDAEAAQAFAKQHGLTALVRYKASASASDFTTIGTCRSDEEVRGYLSSPHCHNVELIYPLPGLAFDGDVILVKPTHEEYQRSEFSSIATAVDILKYEYGEHRRLLVVNIEPAGEWSGSNPYWARADFRRFCKGLVQQYPFIMAILDTYSINWILPCVVDVKPGYLKGDTARARPFAVYDENSLGAHVRAALAARRSFYSSLERDGDVVNTLIAECDESWKEMLARAGHAPGSEAVGTDAGIRGSKKWWHVWR